MRDPKIFWSKLHWPLNGYEYSQTQIEKYYFIHLSQSDIMRIYWSQIYFKSFNMLGAIIKLRVDILF
jgi:hypothetical protein